MSTKVNELTPKVDRYTVTDPDGQLSATEYNVILDAVQRHEAQLDNNDFLRFSEQALDDSDKRQARQNIGVVGEGDYAPKMSVGFADNLIGRGEATAEEFTYRASAGMGRSITDDTARVKKIKGNSVVWNQHTQFANSMVDSHGLKFERNGTTLRVSGTVTEAYAYNTASITTPYELVRDGAHKYYISLDAPQGVAYGIAGFSISNTKPFIWSDGAGGIWNGGIAILLSLGDTIDYTFKNPMIVDLTKAFPNDWQNINTVDDFYARIPSGVDINAYNPGEIISMHTEAIKTVGFNAWDEQWEVGAIDGNNGTLVANGSAIRSGFIQVVAGSVYNIQCPTQVILCAYDDKYQYIKWLLWGGNTSQFTIPHNCKYIKFCTYSTIYGPTYNHDICVNLSHTGIENGKYKPYTPFTRELPIIKKYFPEGMRSAGTAFDSIEWDSTKQKWVAVQRIGSVDLGSLNWTFYSDYNSFAATQFYPLPKVGFQGVCNKYPFLGRIYDKDTDKACGYIFSTTINVRDSSYSDAAAFKAAMQGVMLDYELAEPIVTEIEEGNINFDYYVEDFGTEEALSSVPSAPFRADVVYTFNAVDTIRNNYLEIEELKKQMAQMQNTISAMQVAQVKVEE